MIRARLTYLVLGLVLVAAVGQRVHARDESATPKVSIPKVDGWTQSEPQPLPPASGGYAIGFRAKSGAVVTLYVYDRGEKIPADLADPKVTRELEGAKDAINQLKQMGKYDDATEQVSERSTLGGAKGAVACLYARYKLTIGGEDAISEIYILPWRDNVVKIRATRHANGPKTDAASMAELYTAINKAVATPGAATQPTTRKAEPR